MIPTHPPRIRLAVLAALGLAMTTAAAPPPLPTTPAPVGALISARPFRLQTPFRYQWARSMTPVDQGFLLVLEVDPALVYPRQSPEPVLYVGEAMAQRVGMGWPSPTVVAIVPGDVDLLQDPVWFGTPELPERVDHERAREERALADAAGIGPLPAAEVAAARAAGGERVELDDFAALSRHAWELFRRLTPEAALRQRPEP